MHVTAYLSDNTMTKFWLASEGVHLLCKKRQEESYEAVADLVAPLSLDIPEESRSDLGPLAYYEYEVRGFRFS